MKALAKAGYFCRECGAESPKWLGRCPECGQWNAMVDAPARDRPAWGSPRAEDTPVVELNALKAADVPRMLTPYREVNRVLGGGVVAGSLVLVGGDPGIGKSTLLLQIADGIAREHGPVLYVSGEESAHQVKLRADRLGVDGVKLLFLAETDLDRVLPAADHAHPSLVVIDSIQTMYLGQIESVAGSVAQVRECALRLMRWAKAKGVPIIIAGHVTKEGAIAGPRLLEHMVDVVLYLEGEGYSSYRLLRCVKNRFGSTNETGIFEMREAGLAEVANPSAAFLRQRQTGAIGSAVVATLEGTRPLLVEVQALVTPTAAPVPRRTANGVDFNRLVLICAVLAKHLGVRLADQDVIVNVTGGLRIAEPAADLGIGLALLSSLREAALRPDLVAIGEIGLTGELRAVGQLERRLTEAATLGLGAALVPMPSLEDRPETAPQGLEITGVRTLREALRAGLAGAS